MSLIKTENLTLSYENMTVIDNLSFEVKSGDYVCIVGENGSGKSTLVKALLGLKKPVSGTITFGDGLLQKEIGYLPQQTNAQRDFPASVSEVVISGCLNSRGIRPFYTSRERNIAAENIKRLGLTELKNRSYRELSGGQQQRVSIARALALKPQILFFDEPTSALDPELTGEILKVIKELAEENMTMVIVTHEMAFARDVANHVIFMDNGYIVEEGTPEEVFGNTQNERTKQFLQRFNNN